MENLTMNREYRSLASNGEDVDMAQFGNSYYMYP